MGARVPAGPLNPNYGFCPLKVGAARRKKEIRRKESWYINQYIIILTNMSYTHSLTSFSEAIVRWLTRPFQNRMLLFFY